MDLRLVKSVGASERAVDIYPQKNLMFPFFTSGVKYDSSKINIFSLQSQRTNGLKRYVFELGVMLCMQEEIIKKALVAIEIRKIWTHELQA